MSLPQFKKEQPKDPITQEKETIGRVVASIPKRIGVHAGKGGVGKTYIATQLAMLLASKGEKVGLIDADVDCPNVPQALQIKAELKVNESGKIIPKNYKGIQIVSTALMQDEEAPIIIRGPIKHRLLTDFIQKTAWSNLDALIFDFPPGTSDVPLSAMQVANLTGVIIITTPQSASLADARRAIAMAKKLDTRIYGLIENMSGDTFGAGEAQKLAKEKSIKYLGTIPLNAEIAKESHDKITLPKEVAEELVNL